MRCGQAASSVVQLLLLTCTACLTSLPVAGNPGGEARAGRDYGVGGLCNELHEQAPWPATCHCSHSLRVKGRPKQRGCEPGKEVHECIPYRQIGRTRPRGGDRESVRMHA